MGPLDRVRFFFDAVNRRDEEAALSCFEANAVLSLAPNGGASEGTEAIREALAGFMTMTMKLNDARELRTPDGQLALTSLDWEATGPGPDGSPATLSGKSTEVFRLQPDGEWRMVIDSPWWIS